MLHFKNNWPLPVKVEVYCCIPQDATSLTASSIVNSGLTDVGTGLSGATLMVSPFDTPSFTDLYQVIYVKKRVLKPGAGMMCSYKVGAHDYDPSFHDNHSLTYQRRLGTHQYYYRVCGVLSHDQTTAGLEGILASKVDYQLFTKYVIDYPARAGS